jgi:FSR family fosmidomycin resistance protein-like MFS transporter
VPVWLVREHGYAADAPFIGWTLGVFALAAGVGAMLGGVLAPRIGRRATVVGGLLLTYVPLVVVVFARPGSTTFIAAAAIAGLLIYIPSSVKVVVAQELAPHAPAAAAGMIVGMTSAVAGVLYVGLGLLQELAGLELGMLVGFAMVVPAAAIAAVVLARHPEAARPLAGALR